MYIMCFTVGLVCFTFNTVNNSQQLRCSHRTWNKTHSVQCHFCVLYEFYNNYTIFSFSVYFLWRCQLHPIVLCIIHYSLSNYFYGFPVSQVFKMSIWLLWFPQKNFGLLSNVPINRFELSLKFGNTQKLNCVINMIWWWIENPQIDTTYGPTVYIEELNFENCITWLPLFTGKYSH